MNELEIRIRVNALISNLIENFMRQNQVPASVMVDALNAKLTNLYPRVQQEYFAAMDVARQAAEEEASQDTNVSYVEDSESEEE